MIGEIFELFLVAGITFLPVFLWGYVFSYLHHDSFDRKRFFAGILSGWISVVIFFFLPKLLHIESSYLAQLSSQDVFQSKIFLFLIGLFFIVFITNFWMVRVLFRKNIGTNYPVLIRLGTIHFGVFLLFLFCFFWAQYTTNLFGQSSYQVFWFFIALLQGIFTYTFASMLEESTKHLSLIGGSNLKTKTSLQEMLLLTIFIALGFVWAENILYLIHFLNLGNIRESIQIWILRSFFSLIIHIFAASICTYFWFQAYQRYTLNSFKYAFYLFVGFTIA